MDISTQEKMGLLLKQIQMPEEYINTYFQDSKLLKLEVYKQTKTWSFYLGLKGLLPLSIYQLMIGKLETAFQNIATIDLFIQTDFKDKEESYINDYWHYFLQSLDHLSPAYKDLVNNQTPTIIDKRLLLTARNGAEASALKKRLENEFKVYCEKIGAASYSIEVEVKEDAANLRSEERRVGKEWRYRRWREK